ncbi:uncharacterized protein [Enoplosus armatus]|uniref:uncharacterized protein n=1 Tax=Enoplosus armatus TaxID=215367 RepID=UPI0039928845
MAKRRAEDTLLHDSPSKRCYRSLCSVDMQLGSMAPAGGVSPPSLLALLGDRSRKRPYYFEDPEQQEEEAAATALYRKATHCDSRKHAADVLTVQPSGSFQDRRSSSTPTSSKKRPREDCAGSETVLPKANDKADENTNTEECAYNSFQYWRVPLPELDLSLLLDANGRSQTKDKSKVKDSSSDAMES